MTPNSRFLIVGLGLMGGSYAMGLTKAGYTVTGLDTNQKTIAWALQNHLIAEGTHPEDSAKAARLVSEADYVILGLYPGNILPWLEKYHSLFKPGALVTDLAGVKSCFVAEAQSFLPNHEFIPCHPMAGREVGGVQNANTAMFAGANFIITPTEKNTPPGIEFAIWLAQTLGFGNIIRLSPKEHDSMIGYVSQLTHAIAVCLMNANDDPRLPDVTGDSFRDLTRIADINDTLWSELFLANAPALAGEIDTFVEALLDLRGKLAAGDGDGLRQLMQQSTARRRLFNKK